MVRQKCSGIRRSYLGKMVVMTLIHAIPLRFVFTINKNIVNKM